MKKFLTLLRLEIKRGIKSFRGLLTGTIALTLLIVIIAFCGERLLYNNNSIAKVNIALVFDTESTMAKFALGILENMQSTAATCNFIQTDRDQAIKMLNAREVVAVMAVPPTIMDDIQSGIPVRIELIMPANAGFESAIIKEIADAGASMLSSAQSGIYSLYDFYYAYDAPEQLTEAVDSLNNIYIRKSLRRSEFFRTINTSTTKSLSILDYYMMSGIVLFLLLWGICSAGIVKDENDILVKKLYVSGIKPPLMIIVKTLTLFVLLCLISGLICTVAAAFMKLSPFRFLQPTGAVAPLFALSVLLVILVTSCFIVFIYTLAPNKISGILLLFILSILMVFISGGLVPLAFLPAPFHTLSGYMPTTYMLNTLTGAYLSDIKTRDIWILIEIILALFILASVTEQWKRNR